MTALADHARCGAAGLREMGLIGTAALWIGAAGVCGWALLSTPLWVTHSGIRVQSSPQCAYWAGSDAIIIAPRPELGKCPLFRKFATVPARHGTVPASAGVAIHFRTVSLTGPIVASVDDIFPFSVAHAVWASWPD